MIEKQTETLPSSEISEPLQSGAENQDQPLELIYNPDNLGLISAQDTDEIEEQVHDLRSSGADQAVVDQYIRARLEELGVSETDVHGDVVAIRFKGVDGKEQVRAMKIDPEFFGDNIRDAVLHEAIAENEKVISADEPLDSDNRNGDRGTRILSALEDAKAAIEDSDKETDEVKPEEAKEGKDKDMANRQAEVYEAMVDHLRADMAAIRSNVESSAESFEVRQRSIVNAIGLAQVAVREISNGRIARTRLEELDNVLRVALDAVTIDATVANNVRLDAGSRRDSNHRELGPRSQKGEIDSKSMSLARKADSVFEELARLTSSEASLASAGRESIVALRRTVDEAMYSRHGYEEFASRLSKAVSQLDDATRRKIASQHGLRAAVKSFSEQLNNQ